MNRQTGSAVLMILLIVGAAAAFVALSIFNGRFGIDRANSKSLAEGRDALIGYAATYSDKYPNEVFGYLPCPDADNNAATPGQSDTLNTAAECGVVGNSTVGRLPWKELGLPALRDGAGECLWYALSGTAKASTTKPVPYNWDTPGQFIVASAGSPVPVPNAHDRPLAVVLAAGTYLTGVNNPARGNAGSADCPGNINALSYLESMGPLGAGTTTITLATPATSKAGTNNDAGLPITNKDIFDRVKKRADFKSDIDNMMGDIADCLNRLAPAALPPTSTGYKGVGDTAVPGSVINLCPGATPRKINVLANWKENLLYARPASPVTVSGTPGCNAVLLFGGERTATQTRITAAQKGDATQFGTPAMYLEGNNTGFPTASAYTGGTGFSATASTTDLARCIKGTGSAQISFNRDMASFVPAGTGVTTGTSSTGLPIVNMVGTGGASGGCFWYPNTIPLAGNTLRAYYEYQFSQSDTYALSGGTDRGNGFTLQMTHSNFGSPVAACGTRANMGVLDSTSIYGYLSYIAETDVHRDAGHNDPVENHSAIMVNGVLDHAQPGNTLSTTCNGTTTGCRHAPANKFEETPTTLHNQRIEIHTGCNASCSMCNPAAHVPPNTYARISAWVDCTDCSDVLSDYVGAEMISATQNRDFSAAGNWSGAGWSLTGGAFRHAGGTTAATLPNGALTAAPAAGTSYRVSLKAVTTTAGTITIGIGGVASSAIALTPGTRYLSVEIRAANAGTLRVTPSAAWVGSIDDVSVWNLRTPTFERCQSVPVEQNQIYVGFTGGFATGTAAQGVTLQNFILRTD